MWIVSDASVVLVVLEDAIAGMMYRVMRRRRMVMRDILIGRGEEGLVVVGGVWCLNALVLE
jgi:hypothetical protein